VKGVAALSRSLGLVEAERFIALIQRERFDYTKWRQDLFGTEAIEDLSARAREHRLRSEAEGRREE